jgi:hypothetical protein
MVKSAWGRNPLGKIVLAVRSRETLRGQEAHQQAPSMSEPELPGIQSKPRWHNARQLLTKPKIPGWMFLLWVVIQQIPDWKGRIDFWLDAAKQAGGYTGKVAPFIASPYFSVVMVAIGVLWLAYVGEPRHARRAAWLPYFGWALVSLCFVTISITIIWGAIEIYVRDQVASRQATILHDATNPSAKPSPPDPTFYFQRRLSPDQFREFVLQAAKLKPETSSVLIEIPPGNNEAWALQKDFADAFVRAGITPALTNRTPDGPDQTGVMIVVPDPQNPPKIADNLRDALLLIGIVPKFIVQTEPGKLV